MRLPDSRRRLRLDGYVKARATGRVVEVRVREVARGRTLSERTLRFRTRDGSWQKIPALRLTTTGRKGARLKLRIQAGHTTRKRLLVDSFKITTRS